MCNWQRFDICTLLAPKVLNWPSNIPNSNLRKVDVLLSALDRAGKQNIRYFALDLDHGELVRTLEDAPGYQNVSCYGLWGSYDDGFRWLQNMNHRIDPVTLLFLGSSIGNFPRPVCCEFMKNISQTLRPEKGDTLLVAFDHCNDWEKVWKAYHDPQGKCLGHQDRAGHELSSVYIS